MGEGNINGYISNTPPQTRASFWAAVLMRGHPDLINEFNKWIPMTPQDSCTLLSHHLAATHLENRDLQDKGLDEISFDSYSDPDTETEDNDWISWVTSFTKLGRYTDRFNFWKKMKDRFRYNMDICDWVAVLLRGHSDLIDEFCKWIPITLNNNLQDKSFDDLSTDTNIDTDTDTDTDTSDEMDEDEDEDEDEDDN
ncbi:uncharacterized protein DS421_16g564870 [Arachis hypogaea]|nr:uncharacterized protein DS421_16g564870 [Arachis hypogaea]